MHGFAKVFGASNPLGDQVERAAAAFGKQGDDNGVNVGFSGMNEASPLHRAEERTTPHPTAFSTTAPSIPAASRATRWPLPSRTWANTSLTSATHRAPSATLYSLENRAWITTALTAIGARQKTLTIPGGYIIWNAAWPPADINKLSSDALSEFLKNEALLQ